MAWGKAAQVVTARWEEVSEVREGQTGRQWRKSEAKTPLQDVALAMMHCYTGTYE